MGLREKVALVAFTFISTQIVWNQCMPRGYSNYPFTTQTKNVKSPESYGNARSNKNKRILKKEALLGSCNESAVIRFPDVEYPFESDHGEYYRFLNDYPIQLQSKDSLNISSFRVPNYEREAKCKRKQNLITNKVTPDIKTSSYDYDPLPQPYCFKKSNFFPEVEYPLSSRDMWIPKYWSRLQDAKRNGNVDIGITSQSSASNTEFSDYSSNYANSPLSALIKTLNTNKDNEMPNNDNDFKLPILNEEIMSSTNSDVDSQLPVSKTGHQGEIVEALNAENINIQTESSIPKNNAGSYYNTTSSATSRANNNMNSTTGNNTSGDIIATNTYTKNYMLPELSTAEENKNETDYFVQSLESKTNSDNDKADVSIPKQDPFDGILKNMSNTKNSDLPYTLSILNEDGTNHETIIPITPIASINNAKSERFVSEEDMSPDILTIETNPNNTNISKFVIPKKEKDSADKIVSVTPIVINKSLSGTTSDTLSNTKNNSSMFGLPIFEEDKNLINNILSIPQNTTMSSKISDVCSPKKDSMTEPKSTEQEDLVMGNKSSLNNITENSTIKSQEPISLSKELINDIVKTVINNKDIYEVSIAQDEKSLPYNITNSSSTTTYDIPQQFSDISTITTLPSSTVDIFDSIKLTTTTFTTISDFQYPDIIQMTTPLPDEYMTPSISDSDTLPGDVITIESEKDIPSNLDLSMTNDDSLIAVNILDNDQDLTANAIALNESALSDTKNKSQEVSINPQRNFTGVDTIINTSTMSTIPAIENADSKSPIISTFLVREEDNKCGNVLQTSDVKEKKDALNKGTINLDNPAAPEYSDDSWLLVYDTGSIQDLTENGYDTVYFVLENDEEPTSTANGTVDIIPNSTIRYEYIDDIGVSCTEMPCDFVLYEFPEYVNDTWSVNANDSYLLYPTNVDYSDDTFLLFCDINGTRISGDII